MAENRQLIPDEEEEVRDEVLQIVKHSPRKYEIERTRWRLVDLLKVLEKVTGRVIGSLSTLYNWLRKWGLTYRQGWAHLSSPDAHESLKLSVIKQLLQEVKQKPQEWVVLWLDELTVYRLPELAKTWSVKGNRAQKAKHTPGKDNSLRIAGALNTLTGQVTKRFANKMGSVQLRAFYRQIRQDYPDAQQIFVIQDCWPVHFLPEVSQTAHDLGIYFVPLPTYSSWRNPIEKLWRWLKQDVLHMHPWADDWQHLQLELRTFLDQFQHGSSRLLHYVGLSD